MKKLSTIKITLFTLTAFTLFFVSTGNAMPVVPLQQTTVVPAPLHQQSTSTAFPHLPLLAHPEPASPPSSNTNPHVAAAHEDKHNASVPQPAHNTEDIKNAAEIKEIYLNFENTELSNFIDYIADLKKLNIIPDKTLQGSKISLTIREPLSVEGAWNIFLTVLEMANFSIVKAGEVYKILPKDKKLMQPLPVYVNVPYDTLPESDITIRYVTFLTNIQVSDVKPLLESMLSTPSSVIDQKDMNAFIIADKANNIKSAVKLLQELDQMGLPENVTVLKLKRINAVDAKQLLDALIRKPDTTNPFARLLGKAAEGGTEYFSPTTRIIPEERTNSLILLGNNKSIDKIIDFITKNVDSEFKEASSPLHIYELQHIDATQVASMLKDVTAPPDSTTGQAASKYGAIRGGVKYFKQMTFQVDKDGNRLLVSCLDQQDWELLKKTLQDIDKPQPQVAVESLLVTVTVNDSKSLGGMVRNKKHGQLGANIDFQSSNLTGNPSLENPGTGPVSLLGDLLGQVAASAGQTVLSFGNPSGGIWGIFEMLKSQTNASIISQPFVTIANKTAATLTVGTIERIPSEVVTGSNENTTTGYMDGEASTKIELTPQINLDGVIRMKIKVDIQDFLATPGSTVITGNKTQKTVDTVVTIADGQVLALGGFVQTKVTENFAKTPILGDIPLLGWFFKSKDRTITKQYIFFFLSPTILKPRQMPGMQLYTKMKMHRATGDIEEAIETRRTMDPIHNWFFNPEKENYSHKVIDFANARYQPTTVDIKHDPYYHAHIDKDSKMESRSDNAPSLPQAPETLPPLAVQQTTALSIDQFTRQSRNVEVVSTPLTPPPSRTSVDRYNDDLLPLPQRPEQREQFKELLVPEHIITPAPQAVPLKDEQRNQFKNVIIPYDNKQVAPQRHESSERFIFDPAKRNNLKEFLSAGNTAPITPPTEQRDGQRTQA